MRKFTNQILEAIEAGELIAESVVKDCLIAMSEQEVKEMFFSEEYDCLLGVYEDEDDE